MIIKMNLSASALLVALFAAHPSFVTAKRLGEKPIPDHNGDLIPLQKSSNSRELQEVCQDVPGWRDTDGTGYDCSAYRPQDCELYKDFAFFTGTDGLTAAEACCSCGGGSTPATEPTPTEPTTIPDGFKTECEDIPGWMYRGVNFQFSCSGASSSGFCGRSGQSDEGWKTGNEACCDCGGGRDVLVEIVATLAPTPSPTHGPTESPTAQPTELVPDGWKYECQDVPGWISDHSGYGCLFNGSYCSHSGQSDEGYKTGDEACCKCGGGKDVLVPIGDPLCPTATEEMMASEEEVLRLINEARATPTNCGTEGTFPAAGPLQMNAKLRCAARYHSNWLSENPQQYQVDGHMSPGGALGDTPWARAENAGFQGTFTGENVAHVQHNAREVVDGWLRSDGHCANLMNPNHTLTGVGGYQNYWTQIFGKE